MRVVEIAGPIGAGKSSVMALLVDALRQRGLAARRLDEVAQPGRLAAAAWSAAFALRYPRLFAAAAKAAVQAPIPWWHRRLVLGLALGVGGRLLLASRSVRHDQWVVVDEGLVHRSVNLFAWRDAVPVEEVKGYVAALPADDLVLVVLNTSSVIAERRVAQRGLPERLAGRTPWEVRAFTSRARDIVLLAADRAQERGVRVLRINNSRSLRTAVISAADAVAAKVQAPRLHAAQPVDRWIPALPVMLRPDRALRFRLGPRRPALRPPAIRAVLDAYGLTQAGRPRQLGSPTARGDSLRIRTTRGEVVVKRYKQTVTARSIELEHSVLAALERTQFPAPRLRRTPAGSSSMEVDGRLHAVYEYLAGYTDPRNFIMVPSDRRRVDLMAAAALADLHLALAEHAPPASESLGYLRRGGDRVRPMDWYAEQLGSVAAPRRVRAWLESTLWRIRETLEGEHLPLTVIHGDFGWHNLLLRRGAPLVVVDFELARLDWRVADLAIALPRLAAGRLALDLDRARRFLGAYRDRSEATPAELRRIPEVLAFLSLDRAVVAWGRERDGLPGDWGAEARRRVMLAEELLGGRHPLSTIVNG